MRANNYQAIELTKGKRMCRWCNGPIKKGVECAVIQIRKEGKTVRVNLGPCCVDVYDLRKKLD